MKRHPMAGTPVKVTKGPFKDRYFIVIDWFQNQFQGKAMEKLMKSQGILLAPVKRRGYPLDSKVVFGKLYPDLSFVCMHDDELQRDEAAEKAEATHEEVIKEITKPDLKIVEGEKNGTKKASRRNRKDTESGKSDKH